MFQKPIKICGECFHSNFAKIHRHRQNVTSRHEDVALSYLISRFREKLQLKPLFPLILNSSQQLSQLEEGALGMKSTLFPQISHNLTNSQVQSVAWVKYTTYHVVSSCFVTSRAARDARLIHLRKQLNQEPRTKKVQWLKNIETKLCGFHVKVFVWPTRFELKEINIAKMNCA